MILTPAGVAQLVEQLICNQQVGGSNPFASFEAGSPARGLSWTNTGMAGFPSGQREQTVNLSPNGFEGSNPSPATGTDAAARERLA